jgi:hypothetical protein
VNQPPVAVNDVATTNAGVAVAIAVVANDSNSDGDAVTVSSTADFISGIATIAASGTVTFTPAHGANGALIYINAVPVRRTAFTGRVHTTCARPFSLCPRLTEYTKPGATALVFVKSNARLDVHGIV